MRAHSSIQSWPLGAILIALLLAGCAPQPPGAPASPQALPSPLAPGLARVWFLRQEDDPTAGSIYASQPIVYVDRMPLVSIQQGTAFFHDFAPGRYRLSAQAVGGATYAGQHDILHLDSGTETYVQIIAVGNWELGSPVGGYSFAVLPMSHNVAKQYLLTVTDLGQR
jgi:hypothetical protein